jgi:hypothetical protein
LIQLVPESIRAAVEPEHGSTSGNQLEKWTRAGMRVKQPDFFRAIIDTMRRELGFDVGPTLAKSTNPVGSATGTGEFIQWSKDWS